MNQCKSFEMVEILQSFIHAMNYTKARNDIINYYLKLSDADFNWLGTWIVSLHDSENSLKFDQAVQGFSSNAKTPHDFVKQNIVSLRAKKTVFTVCLVYESNLVHYVAFVYDPVQKKLVSFDPGVELYHHGQKTIVPQIRNIFFQHGLIGNQQGGQLQQNLGRCSDFRFCGKTWGPQYNGNHKTSLPADAFCQSWTIFFILRVLIAQDDKYDFVRDWCKIPPTQREFLIITYFMIPNLTQFSSLRNKYMSYLGHYTFSQILDNTMKYVEKCHLISWKAQQAITCPRKSKK